MKFTLSWLKDYLDTNASLVAISEKLTALGLEVESVTDLSQSLAAFKVAKILEASKHPQADKLSVCLVDNGSEKLQIVCGAPNARAGIHVVLAPVGVTIPANGLVIKKAKIRDVESNGMLCSASELALGEDSAGIIELSGEPKPGSNAADALGLTDPVIEIALTPNRGDCLGVYGIARDLAAAGLGTLKPLAMKETKGVFPSPIKVEIATPKSSAFVGRYFKNVKNGTSPAWLQQRLKAIGLKPISALVDITNYISFCHARPLHVFDAKTLAGNITVREAKAGETLMALDDKTYTLAGGEIVIADEKSPVALAGIMGGKASGCSEKTTDVFLEVALFDDVAIAEAGRKHQIISDARARFERRVDPAFVLPAAHLATQMILELCGGEPSELVIVGTTDHKPQTTHFNSSLTETLGGVKIDEKASLDILKKLGFLITDHRSPITIPSWRPDIEGPADLVEEILRVYGYDHIPATPLPSSLITDHRPLTTSARKTLASRGLFETITFSFMDSRLAKSFGNAEIKLANPISSELDVMRPSILPNLLSAVKASAARDMQHVALFEIGPIYSAASPEGTHPALAAIRSGDTVTTSVHGKSRAADWLDAKADLFAVLSLQMNPETIECRAEVPSYFHPGRSGGLFLGKNCIAVFGEIHPAILKQFDIETPVAAFELYLDKLPAPKAKKGTAKPKLELSPYQAVTRDFAFVVDASLPVAELLKATRNAERTLIQQVQLFDVYQGKNVAEGKKSVALSVTLQALDRTLSENEIETVSKNIIAAIAKHCGGSLRA